MMSRKLKGDYRCTTAKTRNGDDDDDDDGDDDDDDDDDDDGIMFVKLAHVQRICQ